MVIFRPKLKLLLEQPVSSWMFKLPEFQPVIEKWGLKKYLTFMGVWGHDLWKPTHLLSNADFKVQRHGTKKAKSLHDRRMEKKRAKLLASGKTPAVYYKQHPGGGFSGGKDLQKSAIYPQRFVTACYKAWRDQFHSLPSTSCKVERETLM